GFCDFVRRVLPLCNHALQVHLDDLLEQQAAICLDVIEVQDSRTLPPQQSLEHRFSFDERQHAEVFAVQIQQIERDEDTLSLSEKQIPKVRPAGFINACDLT